MIHGFTSIYGAIIGEPQSC